MDLNNVHALQSSNLVWSVCAFDLFQFFSQKLVEKKPKMPQGIDKIPHAGKKKKKKRMLVSLGKSYVVPLTLGSIKQTMVRFP